jgi:hypothetical protein
MTLTKVVGGVIADGTIASVDITDSTITNAKLAVDPANASNLSSGSVPAAQLTLAPDPDFTAQKADIALLAFKTQANGNLARYNLVDQSVDAFEDATGVDASASTGELRNSTGKYYNGASTAWPTGGTVTTYSSGGTDYRTHTFTANGNFISSASGNIDVMLVGGGGGSANAQGGGGAGGGMITMAAYGVTAQTYAIVIGAGGVGQSTQGGAGASTTGFGETATGGGGGGFGSVGGNGANGGGGGEPANAGGTGTIPAVVSGTATGFGGFDGPTGAVSSGPGGSGLGGVGGTATGSGPSGAGGVGKQYNLDGNNYYWGGGGAGATYANNAGNGGIGGGGGGGTQAGGSAGVGGGSAINSGANGSASDTQGGAGGANTGGGGGGKLAGGGSGIVQIRYPQTEFTVYGNMTLVSNAQTAQAQPTKADVVLTYTNGAGTATINTDLIASVSRDGGTTYTAVTLASQGTSGGHTILTANDVSISGQPAGTSMVWKVATANQGASKDTRIHAVSLGWS